MFHSKHLKTKWCRRHAGMSTIEYLMIASIMAILSTICYPFLHSLHARWNRDEAVAALLRDLALARSTAIRTSRSVIMCNSADGTQCAAEGNSEWTAGWLVFQDNNNNGYIDHDDPIVSHSKAFPGITSLSSTNRVQHFAFTPNGLMSAGMSSLVVTPKHGAPVSVVVSRVGRARLASPTS
jgi:type IV fimbrial biogenesis protein FimT